MNNDIYEVSRAEYANFIQTIKPESRRVEQTLTEDGIEIVKIFGKYSGKHFTTRVTYTPDAKKYEPEKYYIYELPDADEGIAPQPHVKVTLETKEEVQAFLQGMKKLKEEGKL